MTASPARPLEPAVLGGPVWVVSPHPDDESLGCGALLAALESAGQQVNALLLTDGSASHSHSRQWPPERLAQVRRAEWHAALDLLGVRGRRAALGLPDGALPLPRESGWDAALAAVGRALHAAPPATVLLPWRRDPHPDHRAGSLLVRGALAGLPRRARLLEYVVWLQQRGAAGDTPFAGEVTTWSLPTGTRRATKQRAVAAHASQLGQVVTDDPAGFTLSPGMVEAALDGPELFLEVRNEQ